ncbi:MAG: EamA family transporter [Austwickia sp.]|nr:EamA family transporter [Austwickia sp.]
MTPSPVQRLYSSAPLLLCLAVLGWSGNFVVGRLVGGSVPPTQLAFLRWVGASLVIVPIAWRHVRVDAAELRRRWVSVLVLSVTGVAIFNSFVYHGLQTTTAVNGLLLQSVCPVLIVLITFAAHREVPHVAQLAGLVVSLVGVWLVVSRGQVWGGAGLAATVGDAWILAAVASYAVYTVALRTKPSVHPFTLLAVTFVVGALCIAPFAAAEWAGGRSMPTTAGAAAAVVYVALVPSIVSYFCFNRGVELAGGARAGQFIHLMPVFGAVLAFVFIGERLAWYHLVGAAVIACGIWLSGRQAESA